MSPLPSVTVVVPTHRRPELMQRAVRSALAQDYDGDLEVLVVFDGEDPYELPVEVPPGRSLRVLANDRVRGLAGARNCGILAAAHELVAFLDDDDAWFPTKLAAQVPRFGDRPVPYLVCGAIVFDDGGRTWERLAPGTTLTHDELLRDRVAGVHSSTFLARREDLLGRLGLVDEDLPGSYGEDYDMLLRASALAPVAVVNEPLVSVTWAQGSHYLGKWALYADGLEYLLAKHQDFASVPRATARIASQVAFARAAAGQPREARRWAGHALRRDPRQVKAWLALLVSLRVVSAARVVRTVQRMGKGI